VRVNSAQTWRILSYVTLPQHRKRKQSSAETIGPKRVSCVKRTVYFSIERLSFLNFNLYEDVAQYLIWRRNVGNKY